MASKQCSIDGCTGTAKARSLCNKHWMRWSRHGDPLAGVERNVASYAGAQCSVDGCCKPARKRGWCGAHYYRWQKHGAPDGGGTDIGAPSAFIQKALAHQDKDQCLIWPFGTIGGYASARIGGFKSRLVSRYVCEQVYGEAPDEDRDCAHSCGNGDKGCINPHHLRWATRAENVADMIEHGTANRGERNNWAKLSEDQVRRIKSMKGKSTCQSMADEYGVSYQAIQSIHSGKSWAWLAI